MADPLRPLSDAERAVIARLCEGDWPGADVARAQLEVAMYAGPSHEGDDHCFDIHVPEAAPRIPRSWGGLRGPAAGLVHYDGAEPVGLVNLWVEDGLLHSVELSWFPEEIPAFPRPDQLRVDPDPPPPSIGPGVPPRIRWGLSLARLQTRVRRLLRR